MCDHWTLNTSHRLTISRLSSNKSDLIVYTIYFIISNLSNRIKRIKLIIIIKLITLL